jgi:hypothetical protein
MNKKENHREDRSMDKGHVLWIAGRVMLVIICGAIIYYAMR